MKDKLYNYALASKGIKKYLNEDGVLVDNNKDVDIIADVEELMFDEDEAIRIYSSRDIGIPYEEFAMDWRDSHQDERIPSEDSQEYQDWVSLMDDINWIDTTDEIKKEDSGYAYLICGIVQRWNGKSQIYPELVDSLEKAIKKCINGADDIDIILSNDKKCIKVVYHHHDGRDTFYIMSLSQKAEEDFENWENGEESRHVWNNMAETLWNNFNEEGLYEHFNLLD